MEEWCQIVEPPSCRPPHLFQGGLEARHLVPEVRLCLPERPKLLLELLPAAAGVLRLILHLSG